MHGALIVQPANHKFDHSYVTSAMAAHPGRFVGCLLADPTDGGGGVAELERLVAEEGYRWASVACPPPPLSPPPILQRLPQSCITAVVRCGNENYKLKKLLY